MLFFIKGQEKNVHVNFSGLREIQIHESKNKITRKLKLSVSNFIAQHLN